MKRDSRVRVRAWRGLLYYLALALRGVGWLSWGLGTMLGAGALIGFVVVAVDELDGGLADGEIGWGAAEPLTALTATLCLFGAAELGRYLIWLGGRLDAHATGWTPPPLNPLTDVEGYLPVHPAALIAPKRSTKPDDAEASP